MQKITIESVANQPEARVIASSMTIEGQLLLYLDLDRIALDPVTDVRVGPVAKDEEAKIDSLARAIYSGGQLQPVVVRRNEEGDYLLVAGRRRYAAFQLIGKKTGEKQKIAAIVCEMNDREAYAAAIQENLQRKQFSPIELAQNILEIRKRNGWDGDDWTKHVAEFLHVSRATVSQHAKLLDLPAKIREKVHSGVLSAQSAFELEKIEEAKREAVLARAEEEAEAEAKAVKAAGKKQSAATPKTTVKPVAEPEEKGKVQHKHIVKAARAVAESENYVKPRSRGEIISFFQTILDSDDAYPEPIVRFAETLVNKWATGQVGDRSLLNKLEIIAEMCDDKKTGGKKTAR